MVSPPLLIMLRSVMAYRVLIGWSMIKVLGFLRIIKWMAIQVLYVG